MTDLPDAPVTGRRGLDRFRPAGPFWRIWHPTANTPAGDRPRHFGPLVRFDPHPAGPPAEHVEQFVLYASMAFEVSSLEVFHRGAAIVDVCPSWRGTLIGAPATARLFDLTDEATAATIGATPRLGDTEVDGYGTTQAWGRFLHASPGIHGLRYPSCRARDRHGIAVALFRQAAIGTARAQHRLIDDALWPYLVHALDSAGVGIQSVDRCPRCPT